MKIKIESIIKYQSFFIKSSSILNLKNHKKLNEKKILIRLNRASLREREIKSRKNDEESS